MDLNRWTETKKLVGSGAGLVRREFRCEQFQKFPSSKIRHEGRTFGNYGQRLRLQVRYLSPLFKKSLDRRESIKFITLFFPSGITQKLRGNHRRMWARFKTSCCVRWWWTSGSRNWLRLLKNTRFCRSSHDHNFAPESTTLNESAWKARKASSTYPYWLFGRIDYGKL